MNIDEVRESAQETRRRGTGKGKKWSYSETILAFLCLTYLDPAKLGGTKRRADGSEIQESSVTVLARALGRTGDSVVLKIMNLRWFLTSGARGMSSGSKMDDRVVREFASHLDDLLVAAATIRRAWPHAVEVVDSLGAEVPQVDVLPRHEERDAMVSELRTDREAWTAVRLGQSLFRSRVVTNFGACCACCGLEARIERLNGVFLVAGHIRPWRISTDHQRLDPSNGLSMCALHDRAFEHGLITLDQDYRFLVSSELGDWFGPATVVRSTISQFHGKPLQSRRPKFDLPSAVHLAFHRSEVFESYLRRR